MSIKSVIINTVSEEWRCSTQSVQLLVSYTTYTEQAKWQNQIFSRTIFFPQTHVQEKHMTSDAA